MATLDRDTWVAGLARYADATDDQTAPAPFPSSRPGGMVELADHQAEQHRIKQSREAERQRRQREADGGR